MIRRKKVLWQTINDSRGFTILELMITMATICILAATGMFSMIDSRRKTQDIVALAETHGFGKSVISLLVDGGDADFAHEPADGHIVGQVTTAGESRPAVFSFSSGVRADIEGDTDYGGSGMAFLEAWVWHVNGDRSYYLMIDEIHGHSDFPD